MKTTNKKYISKEMARLVALATENLLLTHDFDAQLYWNASMCYYCIIVEYVTISPLEILNGYECSEMDEEALKNEVSHQVVFRYNY